MRWILFVLVLGGLTAGVYFFFFHEAREDIPPSEKISDESLPEKDPVAFLKKCLEQYDRTVQGYTLMMFKQERIDGRLQNPEEIKVAFRRRPYSVYMEWLKGARKAERALYVEGKNHDKMLARPHGFLARKIAGDVVERDPDGPDAQKSGRYPINKFGLKNSLERILRAWEKAEVRGDLQVKYLGIFQLKGRPCYKFERLYDKPGESGIGYLVLYIDKETLLLAGTILKDHEGKKSRLLGEYFFTKVHLNPQFPPGQFKPKALIP